MELDARRARWLGGLSLGGLALAVYLPLLGYPYVQDDWHVLALLDAHGAPQVLSWFFDPSGRLFYRPLAYVWFAAVSALSPSSGLLAHLLGLATLVAQGGLLARIAGQLGATRRVAWAAAALHVLAAWVHRDPLSWMVGFHDLGALLLVLLAVTLELDRRSWWAAVAGALALLTKESALVLLPGVLAVIAWRGGSWRSLWAHAPVWASYAMIRALGVSPFHVGSADPYALSAARLDGALVDYFTWIARAVLPLPVTSPTALFVAAGLALVTLLAILIARAPRAAAVRHGLLGASWIVGAMLLPLLLGNHRFAYYLSPALPAVAIAVAWAISTVAGDKARLALALVVALRMAVATHEVWTRGDASLDTPSEIGSNGLAAKAASVRVARAALTSRAWPRGATLVVAGLDIWAFHASDGPRVWCGDPALRIVDAAFLRRGGEGFVLVGAPEDQREALLGGGEDSETLDPRTTFGLALREGQLRPATLDELAPRR